LPLEHRIISCRRGPTANRPAFSIIGVQIKSRVSKTCRTEGDGYLTALLDAAIEGIVAIDSSGRIELFNRGAQEMFGYKAAEVIGHDVSMLMPEPYRDEHPNYIDNYQRTGRAHIIGSGREAVAVRKDGTVFPMELAVNEVHFGARRAYVGIIRDITRRKRLEQDVLNASEREQRRIAQDLHDGLCQELTGIALLAQSAEHVVRKGGTVSTEQIGTITAMLQTAVRHGRALSHSLLPIELGLDSLHTALHKLAEMTADVDSVACRFQCNQEAVDLEPAIATHLYRIAQEAVRDAVRHGLAQNIIIELRSRQDKMLLSVQDDGASVSEDGRFQEELMLRLMRHRAKVIGAKLNIKPWANGLRVTCELTRQRHSFTEKQ
jgi:PAS domain S-box-containing protein